MSSVPILSVKRSVSIDTMINFDGDGDEHGDGDGTCKHASTTDTVLNVNGQFDVTCKQSF